MLAKPLLSVPVTNKDERGMLGIAVVNNKQVQHDSIQGNSNATSVFLYYTESTVLGED